MCLVNLGIRDCGLRTVTSLDVVISCSMPLFQLIQAWLMRCRAVGVRGISSSADGFGVLVLWIR